MLSLLLTILKIIGLILLCIVGLLLLIVLVILFAPIRYQASGSCYEKKPLLRARITWLLRLLSVNVGYSGEDGLTYSLRILGLTLLRSPEKQEMPVSQIGKTPKPEEEIILPKEKIPPKVEKIVLIENEKPDQVEDNAGFRIEIPSQVEESPPQAERQTRSEKWAEKKAAREAKQEAGAAAKAPASAGAKAARQKKKQERQEKIENFLDMIQDRDNQRAFHLVKTQVGKLLRHILPRKLSIRARIGLEDPASTGKLLGLIYAFYPLYGEHIRVIGEFEDPVLEGEFFLKGRIRIASLLIIAARVLLDKNVRRLVKEVRR